MTRTISAASNNTRVGGAGKVIDVWDLREAIQKSAQLSPPLIGYVMDPYLDKSVMKPTAKELLDALNSANKKKAGKDTDFLAYIDYNYQGFLSWQDISTKTEAERKKLVKHV